MEKFDVVVVGGGITGLTAAFEIVRAAPDIRLLLLEEAGRPGGILGTEVRDGYTVDLGPHGFIDNGGDTRTLVESLGISGELVGASPGAAKISLLRDDRLYTIPATLGQLVSSRLLSARAKLRLFAEIAVPRRHEEESVVDFVARRFGREIAETLAVPAVRGVVGGDASAFGIEGEFPLVKELERQYGSVLIGAVRHQSRRHRVDPMATRLPSFREFGNRLRTFRGPGMQRLVTALADVLGDRVRCGATVTELVRGDSGWRVVMAGRPAVAARHVLLALPSEPTARLVRRHHPGMADALEALPRPDIRVLALGYRRGQLKRLPEGIGFIATPGMRSDILGAIHASTIFPEQSPPGTVLIRVLAGGPPGAGILSVTDDLATRLVHEDLRPGFGITGAPVFSYSQVWRRPIPTYPVGHRPRMRRLLAAVATLGGLHLAGNSYFGVGVNDCVRDARRAAAGVLRQLGAGRHTETASMPDDPITPVTRSSSTTRSGLGAG